jgi:transcription initiation factor TFIID TATA-box-binding protein
MPRSKATVNIENVVASAALNQRVDLNALVKGHPSLEHQPHKFPGLVFKLEDPKTTTTIFSSGKIMCVGAKSEEEAREAMMKIIKKVKKRIRINADKPEVKILNIVASADLGGSIDLEKASSTLRKTMYEPEQSPSMIYRMDDPRVVVLLFASGKLMCTGAKKEQEAHIAVHKLQETLEEQDLISYK